MNSGFLSPKLTVSTFDGRNFQLLSPLIYLSKSGRIFRAPVGATTDGLSTPSACWPILAPFGKEIVPGCFAGWKSGVLHDAGYRRQLQEFTGNKLQTELLSDDSLWLAIDLSQAECDSLIEEALTSEGFSFIDDRLVFETLRAVGKKAFAEDRAAL